MAVPDVRRGLLEIRRRWAGKDEREKPLRLTEPIGFGGHSVASFALLTLQARYERRERARKNKRQGAWRSCEKTLDAMPCAQAFEPA